MAGILHSALAHLSVRGHGHDHPHAPCEPLSGPSRMGRGLSAQLPPCDVDRLDYSSRDWSRWDTFDIERHTLDGVRRSRHGIGDNDALLALGEATGPHSHQCAAESAAAAPSSAAHCYFHLFRRELLRTFYRESHQRFRRLRDEVGGRDDFLAQLQSNKQLDVDRTVNFISYALNQEYNQWRAQQKDRMRAEIRAAHTGGAVNVAALDGQVDMLLDSTPFDARSHPPCAPIIAWASEFMRMHLSFQCADPSRVQQGGKFGAFRPLGLWANPDGSFDQSTVYWRAPGAGLFYGHYLHLVDDALIRSIRAAMHASLAAQHAWHLLTSVGYKHHAESQWLLRIAGFVSHAFVLRRSEDELRSRGSWTEADEVRQTDRESGHWVTAELVSFAEEQLGELHDRMRTGGMTEFLSSYHAYALDQLGDMQLHAPSQKCYDMCWAMIGRLQWDLAANLMAASGTFSGPSARSYDLFAGCHNMQDRVDFHLYFKHVFEPYCSAEEAVRHRSDGSQLTARLAMQPLVQQVCAMPQGRLQTMLPPSGNIEPNFHRLWLAKSQLAGYGSLPFAALERLQLRMPYRVAEQRFSTVVGQERCNFFTPFLQMGHAGEDTISLPTALLACARLGGAPVPGAPTAQVAHGDTNCTSYIRLFPRVHPDPDPFHRDKPLAVAGDGRLALSRQICAQYQGFMLVTSLLAPCLFMKDDAMAGSWESNLVLPLGAAGLFADDVALPRAVGSCVRLPPSAILSVRHGGAAVAVRMVSITTDDDIAHSDRIAADSTLPPTGRQPCSVMWVVDASSVLAGCGRVVVHHRHKGAVGAPKPYRMAWLWGGGTADSEEEARALAQVLRSAHISERVEATADWQERNQPRDRYPEPLPLSSTHNVGSQRWSLEAHLAGGALKLAVQRTDVYLPWKNAPIYKEPQSGPLHQCPYFSCDVSRTVNDQAQLQWAQDEDSYRARKYEADQIFEPHRQGKCMQVFAAQPVTERAGQA